MNTYSNFMAAYQAENLNTVPRVSRDVPPDFQEWKRIVDSAPIIVLYLWSEGCRPCHLVRDKFEKMAGELQSPDIIFYKDNIDLPTSFHKEQVEVVPTFFIICDGHEMDHPIHKSRFNGWSEENLRSAILFHSSQSRRAQMRQQQENIMKKPKSRFMCKNNVCYIQDHE